VAVRVVRSSKQEKRKGRENEKDIGDKIGKDTRKRETRGERSVEMMWAASAKMVNEGERVVD
jgi:hypothetical protein